MYLIIGPHAVAILIPASTLILVPELASQQAPGIIRHASQPLFHCLLLFLLLTQRCEFCRGRLLRLLIRLGLLGSAPQFILQSLQVFVILFFVATQRRIIFCRAAQRKRIAF